MDIKKLQDEAAELATRIDAVRLIEGNEDKIAERDLELETLVKRSGDVSKKLKFENDVLEASKNLKTVVERCTPAPEAVKSIARVEAMPYTGRLRAFNNHADAYAAGKWLQGYILKGEGSAEARSWCMEHGVESRAMGSTGAATGAPFVPDILSTTILRLVDQYSAFASNAMNLPMPSDVVLFPKRTGGATAAWLSENAASTPADSASTQITLTAKKVVASTTLANELFQDAPVVADWVAAELALSLSNAIETAAFNGVVANAPLVDGLNLQIIAASRATYAASLTVAAGDTPDEITKANLLALVGKMPQHSRAGAAWYVSPYTWAVCFQALDTAQGGSVGLTAGGGFTFLGYPVVLTDQMPSTADSTDKVMVLFANLMNSSLYGVRKGIELAQSSDVQFLSDQTVIRAVARVGISHHTLGSDTVAGPVQALYGA